MRDRHPSRLRLLPAVCLALVWGCRGSRVPHRAAEWQLEPELKIGSRDDAEQALTSVTALTLGPGKEIYVAQPQEGCIKVFSPAGRLVRTIGRKGEGPGEFMALDNMGWVGDTLYVSDGRLGRVSLFGTDGRYLRSLSSNWMTATDSTTLTVRVHRLRADGTAIVEPLVPTPLIADGTVKARSLLTMDTTGHVLNHVAELSLRNMLLVVPAGPGILSGPQPFGDAPLFAIAPSGDYIAILDRTAAGSPDSSTMRFTKITPQGDTALTRAIPYEPIPFQEQLVDSVIDARAAVVAGEFGSLRKAREVLTHMAYRPAFFPPASGVVVAGEDRIFIRREALPGAKVLWDVLSGDGVHLGSVLLPLSAQVFRANDEKLWTTERDEMDVTYVVRYRIAEN